MLLNSSQQLNKLNKQIKIQLKTPMSNSFSKQIYPVNYIN